MVYNMTQAMLFAEFFGLDLIEAVGARHLRRNAERFYSEFVALREGHTPGDEYDLVEQWAESLRLNAYFDLLDEEEHRREEDERRARATSLASLLAEDAPHPQPAAADPASVRADVDPVVVELCGDAIDYFQGKSREEVQDVAFEIAMDGMSGIDRHDPTPKYRLRSLEGNFTGLQLLVYMYVGFKILEPTLDTDLDFKAEYEVARQRLADRG
jgi:hypothetical protein